MSNDKWDKDLQTAEEILEAFNADDVIERPGEPATERKPSTPVNPLDHPPEQDDPA